MANLGMILKDERVKKGLSQEKLAEMAGVTKRAIVYWENGKRQMSVESADKVFRVLKVTIKIGNNKMQDVINTGKQRRYHDNHDEPILCTGKKDKEGNILFAGDVVENISGQRFEIRFGKFAMYCPVDDCMMENVGFFCVADGYYEDMPLGPTEEYSRRIGNIFDNPELAVADEYRCQAEL